MTPRIAENLAILGTLVATMKRQLTALAALLFLGFPLAAMAQVPSYATSAYGDDQQIRGRISSFDGGYNLQVRDDAGYVDNVQLHTGTIINPTGLTLAPGMVVSIIGYNAGAFFGANEIDTPYTYYNSVPYYEGHPWDYYGSGITLGFFFGNTGWWHGNDFVGGYSYNRGVRVYSHANFRNLYNGGSFQGRNYIAPAARGGYARGNVTTNRTTVINNTNVHDSNITTTRNTYYHPTTSGTTQTRYAPGSHYVTPQTRPGNPGTAHTFGDPRSGGATGGGVRPMGAGGAHPMGAGGGHPTGGGGAAHAGGGAGAAHGGGGGGGGDHHH